MSEIAVLAAVIAVAWAASIRTAAAQSRRKAAADARLQHGLELYQDADYDAAAAEFAEAYDIQQRPDILFAWAQAARLAGRCKLAAKLYEQFLDTGPNQADSRAARQARGMCKDRDPPEPIVRAEPPPREPDRTRSPRRLPAKRPKKRKRVAEIAEEVELDPYEPEPDRRDGSDAAVSSESDTARWSTRRAAFARVHVNLSRREAVVSPGIAVRMGAPLRVFASALLGGNRGFEPGAELALGQGRLQPYVSAALPVFFADGPRPGVRAGVGLRAGGKLALTFELGGTYAFSVPDGVARTVLLGTVSVERGF